MQEEYEGCYQNMSDQRAKADGLVTQMRARDNQ